MGARFIKKSDGNFYMRLDGNTTQVKFAAASDAGNTYTFSVNGTQRVSKPSNNRDKFYTSSASPIPAGGTLNDTFFPGSETTITYAGAGVRDYLLSFTSSGASGTQMYLGGSALSWGGYAYPGSGYLNNAFNLGVKSGGSWNAVGTLWVKTSVGEVGPFPSGYDPPWKEVLAQYIKTGGAWKQTYANYGNSSWICMLEGNDDAIDFCVQVIALN